MSNEQLPSPSRRSRRSQNRGSLCPPSPRPSPPGEGAAGGARQSLHDHRASRWAQHTLPLPGGEGRGEGEPTLAAKLRRRAGSRAQNPKRKNRNLKRETRNPKRETRNLKRETRNPKRTSPTPSVAARPDVPDTNSEPRPDPAQSYAMARNQADAPLWRCPP